MRKAYENFKKDCPTLDYSKSDVVKVKIQIVDPFEVWSLEPEEIEAGHKEMMNNIDSLILDLHEMPELVYLGDLMEVYLIKLMAKEYSDVEFEIDLNKLKYCKTLLAYLEGEEQYAEAMLPIIDDMQDQIVDDLGYDKNRVFYFPEED